MVAHPAKHQKCHEYIYAFGGHFSEIHERTSSGMSQAGSGRCHTAPSRRAEVLQCRTKAEAEQPRSAGFFPQMNADSATEN